MQGPEPTQQQSPGTSDLNSIFEWLLQANAAVVSASGHAAVLATATLAPSLALVSLAA